MPTSAISAALPCSSCDYGAGRSVEFSNSSQAKWWPCNEEISLAGSLVRSSQNIALNILRHGAIMVRAYVALWWRRRAPPASPALDFGRRGIGRLGDGASRRAADRA